MSRTPCPHCHTRAKHGERVSCCSGCGVLFTSGSAFDKHRRDFTCLAPESVGLVKRTVKTDPDATAWGLDGGTYWQKLNCPVCGSGEVGDCVCPTPTPDTERTNAIRGQIDQEAQS